MNLKFSSFQGILGKMGRVDIGSFKKNTRLIHAYAQIKINPNQHPQSPQTLQHCPSMSFIAIFPQFTIIPGCSQQGKDVIFVPTNES